MSAAGGVSLSQMEDVSRRGNKPVVHGPPALRGRAGVVVRRLDGTRHWPLIPVSTSTSGPVHLSPPVQSSRLCLVLVRTFKSGRPSSLAAEWLSEERNFLSKPPANIADLTPLCSPERNTL